MTGSEGAGLVAGLATLGVVACTIGWWRSAGRVRALEQRVARLEHEVHDDVVPALHVTRQESRAASAAAREARVAVGIEDPPPRLAAERITGPVVRAIAFGAGARRALVRFGSELTPLARTRRLSPRVPGGAGRRAVTGMPRRAAR